MASAHSAAQVAVSSSGRRHGSDAYYLFCINKGRIWSPYFCSISRRRRRCQSETAIRWLLLVVVVAAAVVLLGFVSEERLAAAACSRDEASRSSSFSAAAVSRAVRVAVVEDEKEVESTLRVGMLLRQGTDAVPQEDPPPPSADNTLQKMERKHSSEEDRRDRSVPASTERRAPPRQASPSLVPDNSHNHNTFNDRESSL